MSGFVWLVCLSILLAACQPARIDKLHGVLVEPPQPAMDFRLSGPGGSPVQLSDFRGKVVLLFFGYTLCPDMSPATLSEVNGALKTLGKRASEVQFILISVDPGRDTPDELKEYVEFYNPGYIGLTGSPEEMAEVAQAFNIIYTTHEGSQATGYLIDHTATLTLVDRDGQVREILDFGTSAEDIAYDLKYWLNAKP